MIPSGVWDKVSKRSTFTFGDTQMFLKHGVGCEACVQRNSLIRATVLMQYRHMIDTDRHRMTA